MEGWIKIHRRLLDWEWMNCPNMVALWVYLLMKAANEDKDWQGETIEKGQLITSVSTISRETGIPTASVRRGLERLIMSKQVSIQTTKKWSKITICKYESYQQSSQTGEQTSELSHEQTSDQHREKKEYIYNNISQNAGAYAHVREGSYPAENWRFLSSARKFSLGNNPDAIADYKKELIAEELSLVAAEIKMPQDAQEKFLAKWCEHNPGSDKIKADYEATFNIRDRAIQFMGWWNRNGDRQYQAAAQQPKSRSDKFEEEMNKIDAFFDGFYGNRQQTSSVDEQ